MFQVKKLRVRRKFIKIFVLIVVLNYLRTNRKVRGWYQLTVSALIYFCWPWKQKYTSENFEHKDSEVSVIYFPEGQKELEPGEHVWILLPGGMAPGDNFYTEECVNSGLFDDSKFCIFHNPGIVNTMKSRSTPPLAETVYIKDYITHLRTKGIHISVIGWSAGSILAVKLGGEVKNSDVVSIVGIHGPSRIDDVFDIHTKSYLRIDIPFSIWLYFVLWKSKSLQHSTSSFPWFGGWNWMKKFTTKTWRSSVNLGHCSPSTRVTRPDASWNSITSRWLSWEDVEAKAYHPNTLRIVAKNDPIVVYNGETERKIISQQELFEHWIFEDGGHCTPFRWCRNFTARLVRWHMEKYSEYETSKHIDELHEN